jgi:hypothetical protein
MQSEKKIDASGATRKRMNQPFLFAVISASAPVPSAGNTLPAASQGTG